MNRFKKLLNKLIKVDYYSNYEVVEMDDGDAMVTFGDDMTTYSLDLEWEDGVMDIQFGLFDSKFYDTTNVHQQYKTLNTISRITQEIANKVEGKTGEKFHTIVFKSSEYRNGKKDINSASIRTRFFCRYVTRLYPNCEVSSDPSNNTIIIKLNRV